MLPDRSGAKQGHRSPSLTVPKCIILEKEEGITEDPRGVFLTYEAVRILWDLGIGGELRKIGHGKETPHHAAENGSVLTRSPDVETIEFHRTSFLTKPYYVMDSRNDFAQQTVQNGIFQMQPRLGKDVVQARPLSASVIVF